MRFHASNKTALKQLTCRFTDSKTGMYRSEGDHRSSQRDQPSREQRAGKRPVVNPNSKQAELLASVASDMNAFSNDGSFMQKFAASQAGTAAHQNGRDTADVEEHLELSGTFTSRALQVLEKQHCSLTVTW